MRSTDAQVESVPTTALGQTMRLRVFDVSGTGMAIGLRPDQAAKLIADLQSALEAGILSAN